MPSLKSYRTRIASVKNTRKITRAMKLVSAAKLRRAQQAALSHRSYADYMRSIICNVAAMSDERPHPLMEEREGSKTLMVLLTSDRGLCGGFNSNISRATDRWVFEHKNQFESIELQFIGRKGRDYFSVRPGSGKQREIETLQALDPETPRIVTEDITKVFLEGQYDQVFLAYNKFISPLVQEITFERLLPIEPAELPEGEAHFDYLYEPGKAEVLDRFLPSYLSARIDQAVHESVASEHGARMTAMESATKNAEEMIGRLTLEYNRARQAAITTELMEIIGGAEALKG